MVQKHTLLNETPSQTAGPYVHIGCTPNFAEMTGVYPNDLGSVMKTGPVKGQQITITGHIYDGTGAIIRDAMVEIWQADANGSFNDPDSNFTGWGRCATNMETGAFQFETIKPGVVAFTDGRPQAPHITAWIVARGINLGLHTRIYFADEEAANATDPILTRIEHKDRVATLLAIAKGNQEYEFDIRLQGAGETVFFDM